MSIHKKLFLALSFVVVSAMAVILTVRTPDTAIASSTQNVSGWGWSSNIGWISFNNFNNTSSGDTTTYGVNIATDGSFSGYAWSPNIGWIDFNPSFSIHDCPASIGTPGAPACILPHFDWGTKAVTGWARAVSNGGGWDGWISLAGAKLDGTDTYAWGADVVGWLDFKGVAVNATTLATPTISPASATYSNNVSVTMTGPIGATIRYTTNGTDPDSTSAIYSGAITVSTTGTIVKAKAFQTGYTESATASQTYVLTVATPTISPTTGTYANSVTATVSTVTTGATIRYTTDGSTPTVSSPTYSTPLTFTSNKTLKVKAFKTNYTESATQTATYTITLTQCSDGVDNDGDGKTDYGTGATNDPGCTDASDTTESPDPPVCGNGICEQGEPGVCRQDCPYDIEPI